MYVCVPREDVKNFQLITKLYYNLKNFENDEVLSSNNLVTINHNY
jgi:hypothetical protein